MNNHVIEAAGGIVYRWVSRVGQPVVPRIDRAHLSVDEAIQHLELCVVHRPKYDDWSWPKGKLELHESHRHAALREIGEETGIAVELGPSIGEVEYPLSAEGTKNRRTKKSDGLTKHVMYWMARPIIPVDPEARTNALGPVFPADIGEIDERRWVSARAARHLLTHPQDRDILDQFVDRVEEGALSASVLIMVRHGKAMARKLWNGSDANRPITPRGAANAYALNREMACFNPTRLVTSPWVRCRETLQGYSWLAGLPLLVASELTEDAFAQSPEAAWHRFNDEIERSLITGSTCAVCLHRPVIGGIFSHLRTMCASKSLAHRLIESSPFMPTGTAVALFLIPGDTSPSIIDIQRVSPLVY